MLMQVPAVNGRPFFLVFLVCKVLICFYRGIGKGTDYR